MIDAALQRKNMVESQVRPNDISDRRILRAMLQLPREAFLPTGVRAIAYMDDDIPLTAEGQRALMSPRAFAKLVQLAEIADSDLVLDVGAATGYSAAVLSRMCETVVALESDTEMAEKAGASLEANGIDNVVVVTGSLPAGYPDEGPFDAIVVEGRIAKLPEALLDQLKDGGRLVAVLEDEDGVSRGAIWRRIGAAFDTRTVFEIGAPALPGFERPKEFVF